jgi:hypothetical protein
MLPFIVPVTTRESLEFEKELLEELLKPLESRAAVEVLPNVQYSFGHLTHAGPLRVHDGTVYSTKYSMLDHFFFFLKLLARWYNGKEQIALGYVGLLCDHGVGGWDR